MDPVQYPGTDNALATCTGVKDTNNPATSQCTRWTIGPAAANGGLDLNGLPRNVSLLSKSSTIKGKTVEQNLGYYYMTFNIDVSNP